MREFNLQTPLGRRCPLTEDFKDQPRPVNHLALELFFEIALLHRRQRAINDDQIRLMQIAGDGDILDLPLAKQRRRPRLTDGHGKGIGNDQTDRGGKPLGLFKARFGVDAAVLAAQFRAHDEGPRTAGDLALCFLSVRSVNEGQASPPSSPSHSPVRSTGVTGWIVETACL